MDVRGAGARRHKRNTTETTTHSPSHQHVKEVYGVWVDSEDMWSRCRECGCDTPYQNKTMQREPSDFGSTDKSIAGRQAPSLGNEVDGVLRPLLSLAFFPQPVNGCVIIESLHSFNFPPCSSSPTRINNRKRRESLDFVVDPFSSVLHAPEFEAPVHANPEDGF